MRFFKYVVQDNGTQKELRLGYVTYHKDLLETNTKCLGGGMFRVDADKKKIILWGDSQDYGIPELYELQESFNNFKPFWLINVYCDLSHEVLEDGVYQFVYMDEVGFSYEIGLMQLKFIK